MNPIKPFNLSPVNQAICIFADERDADNGNGSHEYGINYGCIETSTGVGTQTIRFQRGPVKEAGFNGITNEALIAVVIDRLQGFNDGPFRCRENSLAITNLEQALHWLNHRTMERMTRGVEGTNQQ